MADFLSQEERKRHAERLATLEKELTENQRVLRRNSEAKEQKRAHLRDEIAALQNKLDAVTRELEDKSQSLAKSDKKYEILKTHFHSELEATKAKLDGETAESAKARLNERMQRDQLTKLQADLQFAESQRAQLEAQLVCYLCTVSLVATATSLRNGLGLPTVFFLLPW